MHPHLPDPGEARVDPARLLAAIKGEQFAGVRLTEPRRTNLLRLLSRLAAQGPLSVDRLTRYLAPLLIENGEEERAVRQRLAAINARLALESDRSPAGETRQRTAHGGEIRPRRQSWRRMRILWMAAGLIALLILAATQLVSLPQPRGPEPLADAGPANEQAAQLLPARPIDVAPPQLTDEIATAIRTAAGANALTAREAARTTRALAWLPAAAERIGVSADQPMPLHRAEFTERLLNAAFPTGVEAQATRERQDLVSAITRSAVQTMPVVLLSAMRDLARPGGSRLADEVFSASRLSVVTLMQTVREHAPAGSVVATADSDLVARGWALAAYELGRPLAIVDADWLPADARATDPLRDWRNWVSGLLVMLAAAVALYQIARRLPLSLDRVGASGAAPRIATRERDTLWGGLDPAYLRRWRDYFARPVYASPEFDLEATVQATARAGGLVKLGFKARRGFATHVAAIEWRSRHDLLASWWSRLFRETARTGLHLSVAGYRNSVHLPWRAGPRDRGYGAHDRLLVLGDRYDVARRVASSPLREAIHPHVVISPEFGADLVGAQDAALPTDRLRVMQAEALSGFTDADIDAVRFLFSPSRSWLDEADIDELDWQRLRGALFLYLEQDGMRWLAGCAIFPVAEEGLAWRIADALGLDPTPDRARRRALRLFASPWMRAGYFPLWLRRRLTATLEARDTQTLHSLLLAKLSIGAPAMDEDAAVRAGGLGLTAAGTPNDPVEHADDFLARFVLSPPGLPRISPAMLPARLRAWLSPKLTQLVADRRSRRRLVGAFLGVTLSLSVLLFVADRLGVDLLVTSSVLAVALLLPVSIPALARWWSAPDPGWSPRADAPLTAGHLRARNRTLLDLAILRFTIFTMLMAAGTAVIIARLLYFAFFASPLAAPPTPQIIARADIIDRNGEVLARTIQGWAIGVRPQAVLGDKPQLAKRVAAILPGRSEAEILAILQSNTSFTYLRRRATADEVRQINAIGEPGLAIHRAPVRAYPQGTLAAQTIGYVDAEGNGVTGVEAYYQTRLSDPVARRIPFETSLDTRVQTAVESELTAAMNRFQAKGGVGIVLDVATGEVLALASFPGFNPNQPRPDDLSPLRNQAIQNVYEFGSTFKPLTAAAALEQGIQLDHRLDATGPLRVGEFFIRDGAPRARVLNVPEAVVYSSNIAIARLADEVGADRLRQNFTQMGFASRPAIDLPGASLPLWPGSWGRITTMTVGYGYGIAVTPMHLASAYATVMNGGMWRPATIRKLGPGEAAQGRRVFTQAVSNQMRQILRLAVTNGTGRNADIAGFRVGGATSTAEKPGAGGYQPDAVVATFVAGFPMDSPRYVVLVMLDSPKPNEASNGLAVASWTAAPVAGRIIARIGDPLGIRPDMTRDIDVGAVGKLVSALR